METTEDGAAAQRKLIKLTHKRLERFVTFAAKFLVNDEPDTIHDLRVWSRRFQQTLRVIVPAKTPASRKIIRILRRVRKALGPCRNIDVNLGLVRCRLEDSRSPALKDGWERFAAHLRRKREPLLAEARQDLARYDLMQFITRAQKLINHADFETDPRARLSAAATRSLAEWNDSYTITEKKRTIKRYHALRIATKRLRYRAEILSDSGVTSVAPMVKDLKEIQSALGDWHDQWVLLESVAAFVARPKFPARHADARNALRTRIEVEKKDNAEAIEKIVRRAALLRKRWDKCLAEASRPALNG